MPEAISADEAEASYQALRRSVDALLAEKSFPLEILYHARHDIASRLARQPWRDIEDQHPEVFSRSTHLLTLLAQECGRHDPEAIVRLLWSYSAVPASILLKLLELYPEDVSTHEEELEPVLAQNVLANALGGDAFPKAMRRLLEHRLVDRFYDEGALVVMLTGFGGIYAEAIRDTVEAPTPQMLRYKLTPEVKAAILERVS